MKRLLTFAFLLFFSAVCFAQNNVTQFLGIPIDGTKSAMIQKLKAKGFTYDAAKDVLEGEFNGQQVLVSVVTENNKVYRICLFDKMKYPNHKSGSGSISYAINLKTIKNIFQ